MNSSGIVETSGNKIPMLTNRLTFTMTNSTSSLTSEIIDEEISLDQLQHISGGLAPLAVIAAVKLGGAAVAAVGGGVTYGVSKLLK